jgi:hypothetical protein
VSITGRCSVNAYILASEIETLKMGLPQTKTSIFWKRFKQLWIKLINLRTPSGKYICIGGIFRKIMVRLLPHTRIWAMCFHRCFNFFFLRFSVPVHRSLKRDVCSHFDTETQNFWLTIWLKVKEGKRRYTYYHEGKKLKALIRKLQETT